MNLMSVKLCSQKKELAETEINTLKCILQLIDIITDEIALYQLQHNGNTGPYFTTHVKIMYDKMCQSKSMFLTDDSDNVVACPITSDSTVIGYGMRKIFNNVSCYSPVIKLCHIYAENNAYVLPLNRLISESVNLNEANVISYLESFCQLKKCINEMYSVMSKCI